MDVNNFSERAREAIETAQGVVRRGPGNVLGTEHLLIGVLALPGGVVEQILNVLGVDKGVLMTRADQLAQNQPVGTSGPSGPAEMLYMTPRAKAALDIAVQEAQKLGDEAVGTEHLLLGIFLEGEGPGSAVLRDVGVTEDALRRALSQVRATGEDYEATASGESMLKKYTPRPHGAGARGQARPRHRPRRGDQARHPGAVAAHQEQPGAHRRARRRQDRHRRGARPEDRRRGRARDPARQARAGAGPRRHGGRREVPRRVRGAPQGRPGRDPALAATR